MRRPALVPLSLLAAALTVAACKTDKAASTESPPATVAAPAPERPLPPSGVAVPVGLPDLPDPPESPSTPEKVALGYTLFFDKRLSKDDSMACAQCHLPQKGWVGAEAMSVKVGGGRNTRTMPTMLNVGYHREFYWDGRMPTLEAVSTAAWKGQLGADPAAIAQKLNAVPAYKERFTKAFSADATPENIAQALASFLRALKSGNSPYDRFVAGDKTAMDAAQQRGWDIFQKSACVACHLPPLFTNLAYHNVGIGSGKPEAEADNGRMNHTKNPDDKGRFKTPTLRDVALTGPYFHDGSAATLKDAIAIMAGGGVPNPGLDPTLADRKLSDADKADLEAFLGALTGTHTFTQPPTDIP